MIRTQIYLSPADHAALKREARAAGVSMTELIRRLIGERLRGERGVNAFTKEQVLAFIDLGDSGETDVSERHDAALAEAFRNDRVR